MIEKNIIVDEQPLFYKTNGDAKGKAVVLLHGFAEDSSIWNEQVKKLKQHYRLVVPELAGSGASPLAGKQPASLEDHARSVKQVLIAEGISSCIMIGHSMGGYITLAFVEKYPEMVNAFGLFHSSAFADDAEKLATRKKGIEFIQTNGAIAFLKTSIPGLFYDTEKSKPFINELIEKGSRFTPAALIHYYEAMMSRPDRTAVLSNSKLPVLLILGEHDKAVPFQAGLQQAILPSQLHLHILRDSAHMGMLEETEKSNTILANFLQYC